MVCKYRIHFNPCSWHIISFKWHNLIKLGVTLIKVQTADDIYPLLPHCVGVFFESEAWIWWNWINKMPLYWLFFICRGVNLLKYFWKTIFLFEMAIFKNQIKVIPRSSYGAIYKAVTFYYLLNTLFLQSKWPKWPQEMTKSQQSWHQVPGVSKAFILQRTVREWMGLIIL